MQKKPSKDDIVAYHQDVIMGGYTKKDSYVKNVNGKVKNPSAAVIALEKTQESMDIRSYIMSDDTMQLNAKVKVVKKKYVDMVEKNIDTMTSLLDEVKTGKPSDKATAIRLANESIGAMALVNGPSEAQPPGQLNKAAAIL